MREDKKTLKISKELHKKLKLRALEEDKPLETKLEEIVKKEVDQIE